MFSYFALHSRQVLLCVLAFPHLKSFTYDRSFQHRSALPGSADGKSERREAGVIEVETNGSCLLNDAAYLQKRWKPSVLELNVHPEFHLICRLDYSLVTEGGPLCCHLPKSQASISRNIQLTCCQIYLESVLTLPSINTPSWRFIHRILGKLTIALNLSGPVTAACPQTERLLCNIYQGLLPLRRGFITELLIYKNEAPN